MNRGVSLGVCAALGIGALVSSLEPVAMARREAMGVVGLGRSLGVRPGEQVTGGATPVAADVLAQASAVEREVLARLERIERGLFRQGSTLAKSERDSLEQRIEDLSWRLSSAGQPPAADDAGALRNLQSTIDELGRDLEREVADVLERMARTVEEIDRRGSREGDLGRRLDDLSRAVARIDGRLESIERRIR